MKKNLVKYLLVLFTIIIISTFQNCDDSITSSDIANLVMPDSNVSYSIHIAPVFEVMCVGCHNSQTSEGGVDLSSWANATRDPSVIFPGSDSTSILVWTIERLPPYPPMPPFERLKQNHIDGIRIWIREGAKNN